MSEKHKSYNDAIDDRIAKAKLETAKLIALQETFAQLRLSEPDAKIPFHWLHCLSRILAHTPPDYTDKLLAVVPVWAGHDDEPREGHLVGLIELTRRLCHPPYSPSPEPVGVWYLFCGLGGDDWYRIAYPRGDAAYAILEEAVLAEPEHLPATLARMIAIAGSACAASFSRAPRLLMTTVRRLLDMGPDRQEETLASWRDHPFLALDAGTTPFAVLVEGAREHLPAGIDNPIPRKLRDVVAGRLTLTGEQEARMRRVLEVKLGVASVGLLAHLAGR